MSRASVRLIIVSVFVAGCRTAGRWLLVRQEIGGQKKPAWELMLRVNRAGTAFDFACSVPVNDIQFVPLKFSAGFDGTEADVTNANGQKIGTVKVTRSAPCSTKSLVRSKSACRFP